MKFFFSPHLDLLKIFILHKNHFVENMQAPHDTWGYVPRENIQIHPRSIGGQQKCPSTSQDFQLGEIAFTFSLKIYMCGSTGVKSPWFPLVGSTMQEEDQPPAFLQRSPIRNPINDYQKPLFASNQQCEIFIIHEIHHCIGGQTFQNPIDP